MYGKKHSEESIIKMSKNKKGKNAGKNHPKSKKIKCIETGEIFNSIRECAGYFNLNEKRISDVCRGVRKTTGKKHFRFI